MVVCVRSLVPKLKNCADFAILSASNAARGISIMVPTMIMQIFQAGLAENFLGDADDDRLLIVEFLRAADQRNHHLGDHLDAFLGNLRGRFENGARLHLGDLGISDTQDGSRDARAWD